MAACASCATEVQDDAKFCHECGAPASRTAAEYKQVTVLFADVVRSMDIASAVDAERLREIMTDLFESATGVVSRCGGTVNQFTGDGIMAVFGAPTALEDHAFRACLAALEIQRGMADLGAEVERRDGIGLQLRIGLNSGQVVTGEIGSGGAGYTAIGQQVGLAQRMESVAPPGAVMLSESTARLVENAVQLGDPELVHVKNVATPVRARRLLAVDEHRQGRRGEAKLVGRSWELNTITAILDEAVGGAGCVVTMSGPPGIGKSRLVRESSAIATSHGIPVFATYCESHTSDIPFRAVTRLLRSALGVGADDTAASAQLHERFPDAHPEDLILLEDLLGVRDTTSVLPDVAAEAWRRRLTALINAASLARTEPAVYVIEDAHWIDESSESMLADFLAVVPQTPSLTLITYRPEYRGTLARLAGAQNLALRPLSDAQASSLTAELLGADPSIRELAELVRSRAAGNPFFAEEIVRDLTERGVIGGEPGAYALRGDIVDANVPASLQSTIGARIDRLDSAAKDTLNAAAVIGARFDDDLLAQLVECPELPTLIEADLVNQVAFSPRAEYAFRHPLIRTVAYESQLKSDRRQRHRTLAAALEAHGSTDENSALIAEHLEAAGDLRAAYDWHMRAGAWSNYRDIAAARTSWRRAQRVADQLPEDDPDRMSMRIATRTQLAGTAWRIGGGMADPGFDELQELCMTAGDKQSLAIGLAGLVTQNIMSARRGEASRLADELVGLLESLGDPALTVALSTAAMAAKHEAGEIVEAMRLAQNAIDVAGDDAMVGHLVFEHPLAMAVAVRGVCRFSMGQAGWREDLDEALAMTRATLDPMTLATVTWWTYGNALCYGVLVADATALHDTAETLSVAEQSGDDYVRQTARMSRGVTLLHQDGPELEAGLALFATMRDLGRREQFTLTAFPVVELHLARETARLGDVDSAISVARTVASELFDSGGCIWTGLAVDVLVDALLKRGDPADRREAQAAIDRLAAQPTDPGFVLYELTALRLRTLLARAGGDQDGYLDHRERYLRMATDLGFEGHMAMAQALSTNQ